MQTFILGLSLAMSASAETVRINPNQTDQARQASDRMARAIQDSRAQVVFLPEYHKDFVGKAFNAGVIEEFARQPGRKVCYFLEANEAFQPALDRLDVSDPRSMDCFNRINRDISRDFLEIFGRSPSHWLDLAQLTKLRQSGVKILAIDQNRNRDTLKRIKSAHDGLASPDPAVSAAAAREFDNLAVRDRNPAFAARVRDGMSAHRCDIGFVSAGTYHVLPKRLFGEAPIPPIAAHLPKSLRVLTINTMGCGPNEDCQPDDRADLNVLLRR